MKKSTFIMIISICLLFLAGCGGQGGEQAYEDNTAENPEILSIKSDPLWADCEAAEDQRRRRADHTDYGQSRF